MTQNDRRKWFEIVMAVAALVVSAASLWVAMRTEEANRKMVSAASWPLLQIISSDADETSHVEIIKLALSNAGVGPAKIKTFELMWKGRPMRGATDLLTHCCGYIRPTRDSAQRPLLSTVPETVLRAGETRPFLIYSKAQAKMQPNASVYERLDDARQGEITYRACYCSVFDECWISDGAAVDATPVKACVAPKIQYND